MSGSKVKQENSLRTKGRSKANKCGDPKQEEIKKKIGKPRCCWFGDQIKSGSRTDVYL